MKVEFVGNKLSYCEKCAVKKAFKMTIKELEQPKNLCICVNSVSPEEMRKLNSETRGIDKETDVLSFPSYEISPFENMKTKTYYSGKGHIFIGDMAINMVEVQKQSEEYNETRKRSLSRLVIHSILHMLGFDHIEDDDYFVMEPVQNKILDMVTKK